MNLLVVVLIASSVWVNPVLSTVQTNRAAQEDKRVIKREGVAEFIERKGNHTAKIIFETKLFDARKHKIGRAGDCVTIDGRVPLGTDCGMPQVEIASIKFFLDGKEVSIPRNLYADCYTPPYFKEYKERGWINNYLNIKFSDDLENVFVFLAAGDGAGVYDVIWVLRKDGRHTRFTESSGDCRLLNFECSPGGK
jgi:hypothetical protein